MHLRSASVGDRGVVHMFRPPSVGFSLHQRGFSGGSEAAMGDFHSTSSVAASGSAGSSSPTSPRTMKISASSEGLMGLGVVNPNSSTLVSLLEDSDDEEAHVTMTLASNGSGSGSNGHGLESGSIDMSPINDAHSFPHQARKHPHNHQHRKPHEGLGMGDYDFEQDFSKEGKATKVLRILNPIPLTATNYLAEEFYDENAGIDCCAQWSAAATHIFFSQQFPTLYIVLILLNLLTLTIIVYEHATSKWEDGYPTWFIGLEMAISIAFAIELGIRLVSMGRRFFDTFSNIFDLCTLLLCLVSFAVYFRLEFHETQAEELAALFLVLRYSAQFLRLLTLVKNRQKTIHLSQSIVDFTKVQSGDLSGDDSDCDDNPPGNGGSIGTGLSADDSPTHRHYLTPRTGPSGISIV